MAAMQLSGSCSLVAANIMGLRGLTAGCPSVLGGWRAPWALLQGSPRVHKLLKNVTHFQFCNRNPNPNPLGHFPSAQCRVLLYLSIFLQNFLQGCDHFLFCPFSLCPFERTLAFPPIKVMSKASAGYAWHLYLEPILNLWGEECFSLTEWKETT